jgi:DNA-binding response OmpR family regulator
MKPERAIILDSNPKSISLVREILSGESFDVLAANNGEKAVNMVATEQPDLIILEINLKGKMDGFEVIQRVREFSEVPIVVLTECCEPEDMVRAFDLGADDYVLKPFNAKVLLARLRAIFKRYHLASPPNTVTEIVCGHLKIDLLCRQVSIDGVEIYLAETEYNLLLELARHHDEVLLHEQLLLAVWGPDYQNEVDYLRSYVHMLRRKLEVNPANPKMIISKSGVGYMLVSSQAQFKERENGD